MFMFITQRANLWFIPRIKSLFVCILFAMCTVLTGCNANDSAPTDTLPDAANQCVDNYLKIMETDGSKSATDFLYFENNTTKEMFGEANMTFNRYSIDNVEKVNDNLYVLSFSATVAYHSPTEGEEPDTEEETGYNYVANINGDWRFILNKNDIPTSIQENFDSDKYQSSDPDAMDANDVTIIE